MKKALIIAATAMVLLAGTAPNTRAINPNRGGIGGFFAGCCFGIRSAAAYNDGKVIHWREWGLLIPFVRIWIAVWNGIDGASGMTTSDYVEQYGSTWY